MDRAQRRYFALGWLFLLHGLADVTVGLYRCNNILPPLTDVLAAALPVSQLCLLLVWLVFGCEPLSWRVAGLVAGSFFIFSVFTRLLFPYWDPPVLARFGVWTSAAWWTFFRPSGPGFWLLEAPFLAAGILLPLAVWRWRRGWWMGRPWRKQWWLPRFGFADAFVWVAATCLVLGVVMAKPPYPGWQQDLARELRGDWWSFVIHGWVASSVLHVAVTLLCLWMVATQQSTRIGILSASVVIILCGVFAVDALRWWQLRGADDAIRWIVPSETWTTIVLMLLLLASFQLMRLYDGPVRSQPRPPGRSLPEHVPIDSAELADAEAVPREAFSSEAVSREAFSSEAVSREAEPPQPS